MLTYKNVDQALPALSFEIKHRGAVVGSRQGDETREILHETVVLTEPYQREITIPHRKASLPAQIAETMWVLAGRDDIDWLSHYLPRAAEFSDDGKVWRGAYGPRLRNYGLRGLDQIDYVTGLLREDINTRRAVINIYDAGLDAVESKDIPCNDFLHFIARDGVLDLAVYVRSNDLIWGWSGINQFEWSVLQEIVATHVGLGIGKLVFHIGSLHVYERHFAKMEKLAAMDDRMPAAPTQAGPAASPRYALGGHKLEDLIEQWFWLEGRIRLGRFVDIDKSMPEPMLASWLHVLNFHWNGVALPGYLQGTRLDLALAAGATSKQSDPEAAKYVMAMSKLHAEKHAAYGNSWRKHGEMFSVLPNIARKVDRLAAGTTTRDEDMVDTTMDLIIYLAKYVVWLKNEPGYDEVEKVEQLLFTVAATLKDETLPANYAGKLEIRREGLMNAVQADSRHKDEVAMGMLGLAYVVGRHIWWKAGNANRKWNPES